MDNFAIGDQLVGNRLGRGHRDGKPDALSLNAVSSLTGD
jgi:hypothetical protein